MLTKEHRDAVARTIPGDVCPLPTWWDRLEGVIDLYRMMEERRTTNPPWRELERWQRIARQRDDLVDDLAHSEIADLSPWRAGLRSIKQRAESAQIAYDMMGHGYRGTHREVFFMSVLDLWLALGHGLTEYWRPHGGGPPRGSLIDFFDACARPVLGDDTPKPEGIAEAIKRRRGLKRKSKRRR
jgi:hypothetical protein